MSRALAAALLAAVVVVLLSGEIRGDVCCCCNESSNLEDEDVLDWRTLSGLPGPIKTPDTDKVGKENCNTPERLKHCSDRTAFLVYSPELDGTCKDTDIPICSRHTTSWLMPLNDPKHREIDVRIRKSQADAAEKKRLEFIEALAQKAFESSGISDTDEDFFESALSPSPPPSPQDNCCCCSLGYNHVDMFAQFLAHGKCTQVQGLLCQQPTLSDNGAPEVFNFVENHNGLGNSCGTCSRVSYDNDMNAPPVRCQAPLEAVCGAMEEAKADKWDCDRVTWDNGLENCRPTCHKILEMEENGRPLDSCLAVKERFPYVVLNYNSYTGTRSALPNKRTRLAENRNMFRRQGFPEDHLITLCDVQNHRSDDPFDYVGVHNTFDNIEKIITNKPTCQADMIDYNVCSGKVVRNLNGKNPINILLHIEGHGSPGFREEEIVLRGSRGNTVRRDAIKGFDNTGIITLARDNGDEETHGDDFVEAIRKSRNLGAKIVVLLSSCFSGSVPLGRLTALTQPAEYTIDTDRSTPEQQELTRQYRHLAAAHGDEARGANNDRILMVVNAQDKYTSGSGAYDLTYRNLYRDQDRMFKTWVDEVRGQEDVKQRQGISLSAFQEEKFLQREANKLGYRLTKPSGTWVNSRLNAFGDKNVYDEVFSDFLTQSTHGYHREKLVSPVIRCVMYHENMCKFEAPRCTWHDGECWDSAALEEELYGDMPELEEAEGLEDAPPRRESTVAPVKPSKEDDEEMEIGELF